MQMVGIKNDKMMYFIKMASLQDSVNIIAYLHNFVFIDNKIRISFTNT